MPGQIIENFAVTNRLPGGTAELLTATGKFYYLVDQSPRNHRVDRCIDPLAPVVSRTPLDKHPALIRREAIVEL